MVHNLYITVVSFSFWKYDKEKLQDYVFLFQN